MNKKTGLIIGVCTVAAVAVIAALSVFFYKENKSGSSDKAVTNTDEGDNLADGQIFDYEKAGYISLGKYKGLSVDVEPEVDDIYGAMLDDATENEVSSKDAIKSGDVVNIDFTGKKDGKKIDGTSAEDTYVWVGKGEYIDDFENGIIGMKKGEKKTVDCTFPSDYDEEDLAGQTVQFTITVNDVVNDAIAKKVSDNKCKNVQEYYDKVKQEQKEDNINNKGELVWDSFKETCEAKSVPENMLAQSKTDVNLMYTNFAEMSGMTLDELLESFGMDEDGVSEIAEDSVIDVMIAKSIMAKENLTMDDTTYKNKLWTALGYEDGDDEKSLSDLEKEYKESQGSHPKNDMMIEVAKDYIGDQAKVSDGETTNE